MTAPFPSTALLLLLALLLLPAATAHTDEPGHGHLFVSLGDDSNTVMVEPDDQVTFRFEGSLPVEQGGNGTAYIRLAIPDPAQLQTFIAPDLADKTERSTLEQNGTQYAVLAWTEDPPAAGTAIHDVHLVAVRTVDPRASFLVRWGDLDRFESLPVRAELPQDHTLTSGRDLIPLTHNTGDRRVWNQHDFDGHMLEVVIHPLHTGPDRAISDPPAPYNGWLIIFGIALVSGAAWAIGKKLENRSDE